MTLNVAQIIVSLRLMVKFHSLGFLLIVKGEMSDIFVFKTFFPKVKFSG